MKKINCSYLFNAVLATVIAFASAFAQAETVSVVIPFPAGGVTDRIWRTLEPELNQELKPHNIQLITEYVTGNGGAIGAARVAVNTPGQPRLLFTSSSLVISMVNNSVVSYTPEDFSILGYFGSIPMFLAVPESGPSTLQEFAARCRGNKLNYATAGIGSTNHLATVAFLRQQRCNATPIPYKSQTLAVPDLIAGRIDFIVDFAASVTAETAKQGKLKNVQILHDLPVKNWHVLAANKNFDAQQMDIIKKSVQRVLANNSTLTQFQQLGLTGINQNIAPDFLEQQKRVFDKMYQEISK